jgi:hypothetical protein
MCITFDYCELEKEYTIIITENTGKIVFSAIGRKYEAIQTKAELFIILEFPEFFNPEVY